MGSRMNTLPERKLSIIYGDEALDFEVLNYTKIAAEQKKLREEKEMQQREKFMKFINRNKTNDEDESSDNTNE